MIDFLKWLLFGLVLGAISFPITWRIFPKLTSRGYYLTKPVGLLLWGFFHWLFVSLGLTRNNLPAQLTILFILLIVNGLVVYRVGWQKLRTWIVENKCQILITELVYLVFFGMWTIVRAANPDIIHTEKFMEFAFINGILKSATFPPMDPWLSGYGISYYYFGYVLSAMLIRITGVSASVGYNLTSSFWFGVSAVGAYGIITDLLCYRLRPDEGKTRDKHLMRKILRLALIAPIMLLFMSNWFGAMDVAHSRGIGYSFNGTEQTGESFWGKFNIAELQNSPREASWRPDRGGWSWWQASRVLKDHTLDGNAIEVIDEFPQFTFLLSDVHPHMLGIPFVILVIAQALNAIQGGWENVSKIGGKDMRYDILLIAFAALSLGGIAFLNTWDFPFYLALIAASMVYRRYLEDGWKFARVFEFFVILIIGALFSVVLYLPFYISFASQAGGILPSLAFFTPGKNFWVMFGPLLVPIILFQIFSVFKKKTQKQLGIAVLITLGIFFVLFSLSWGLAWLETLNKTSESFLLGLQGAPNIKELFVTNIMDRLKNPGTAIILFVILSLSISFLLDQKDSQKKETPEGQTEPKRRLQKMSHVIFVALLIILGGLLVLAPEFVYLRDQFSWRMNTIFKFYFQTWVLWSLAAAYGITSFICEKKSSKVINGLFVVIIGVLGLISFGLSLNEKQPLPASFGTLRSDWLILAIALLFLIWIIWLLFKKQFAMILAVISLIAVSGGLVYPILEIWNKTEGFKPRLGMTLDGKRVMKEIYPDAITAAEWLQNQPVGVLAEAVADQGGSYTTYNLVSTFSGMPSVLGWVGHEHQWRGGGVEVGTRQQDLRELYASRDLNKVKEIIEQYNIRYIMFGNYEREVYRVTDPIFTQIYQPVFQSDTVQIFDARP